MMCLRAYVLLCQSNKYDMIWYFDWLSDIFNDTKNRAVSATAELLDCHCNANRLH